MSELGTIIRGKVVSGRLAFEAMERSRWIAAIANMAGDVEIIIRKPVKDRSIDQNSYYWGVVIKLTSEASGHAANEQHKEFKAKFLGGRSTTKLTTKEFEDYIEQIRAWSSEQNIIIPDPERVDYE